MFGSIVGVYVSYDTGRPQPLWLWLCLFETGMESLEKKLFYSLQKIDISTCRINLFTVHFCQTIILRIQGGVKVVNNSVS